MKITLSHEGTLTQEERADLRYLLVDALADFIRARAGSYVERRYPEMDVMFKMRKANEMARRITLAHKLHNAALHITIESEDTDFTTADDWEKLQQSQHRDFKQS